MKEVVTNLEGDELRKYVYEQIKSIPIENPQNQITESEIGILIRHHCGQRIRKKSALLALPHIINANYITHPWRRKVDKQGGILKGKDARQSGMISAPILIDGVKYLCNITQKINVDGTIFPYALTLKDADGSIIEGEKMDCTFQVPDSNSEHPTFGDTHISKVTTSPDTNPSSTANIVKGNNTNENKSRRNMKKTITESQLKGIIAESVKQVLKEGRFDQPQYYSNPNPKAKSKEERFREMLLKDIASVSWGRVGTDTPWAKQANAQAKAVARKWNLSIRDLRTINFAQNYSVNDTQSEALINKAVKDYINTGMFIDKERMNSDFDDWFDDVMHSPEGKQIGQRNRPQSMKESKLRKVVAESVRKVLKEAYNPQEEDYLGYRNGDPKPKSKEEREKERKLRDKNWDNPSAWKNMMKEGAEYKNLFSFDNQFFDEKAAQMAEQLGNYLAQKYGVSDDIIVTIGEVINDAINSNSLRA